MHLIYYTGAQGGTSGAPPSYFPHNNIPMRSLPKLNIWMLAIEYGQLLLNRYVKRYTYASTCAKTTCFE